MSQRAPPRSRDRASDLERSWGRGAFPQSTKRRTDGPTHPADHREGYMTRRSSAWDPVLRSRPSQVRAGSGRLLPAPPRAALPGLPPMHIDAGRSASGAGCSRNRKRPGIDVRMCLAPDPGNIAQQSAPLSLFKGRYHSGQILPMSSRCPSPDPEGRPGAPRQTGLAQPLAQCRRQRIELTHRVGPGPSAQGRIEVACHHSGAP